MTPLAVAVDSSGLRKDWIARQLGVSPSLVSMWLSGDRTPNEENKTRLALLLRRDRADLFPAPLPEAPAA